jgi:TsgA-like MFS transporter
MAKLPATLVAIVAYAVMSGFVTQEGVILMPAAAGFARTAADTAPLFSYILVGNLVGFALCLVAFNVATIRQVFAFAYATLFVGVAMIVATHTFAPATVGFALVGFGAGIGLSAGAVIIARSYSANRRAVAFLGTDCAFSVAGFVFPAVTSALLVAGYGWRTGYVVVAAVAAVLLVAVFLIRLPEAPRAAADAAPATAMSREAGVRVALFALGLCLYLCGQYCFLIWAPTVLQGTFGMAAPRANAIVGTFWGPSIFGLLTAAVLVSRVPPRRVLLAAALVAVACTLGLATTASASTFFTLTLVFGFSSTCMYKLMISIGSEQVVTPSPRLVTFLLLAGAIGGTIAPALSGGVVHALGTHAAPALACACYAGALAAVVAALALEAWRGARRGVAPA